MIQSLKRMAAHSSKVTQVIACHGCERRAKDDGSWNKRIIPSRRTEYVCHVCFAGVRRPWKEEFMLAEKANFGTVHTPRGYPTTELDFMHSRENLRHNAIRGPVQIKPVGNQLRRASIPYVYSPLEPGHIRVLDILPGNGNSEICCNVRYMDLNAKYIPRYEALSYCWEASDEEKRTISLESCDFVVSRSLFEAMKHLRDQQIPRTFWIDAISINQDKQDTEKAIQISLMGRIYQNAFEVTIWLGPSSEHSDEVMDAIAIFDIENIQTERFTEGYSRLLRRAWFFRTWTVQEFVLVKFPPKIQCGSRVVTSGQMFAVLVFLDELRYHSDELKAGSGWQTSDPVSLAINDDIILEHPLMRLGDLRSSILDDEGVPQRRSLAGILKYYRTSRVNFTADKVYGTLGLVNEVVHEHIRASSTKSAANAYTDAMTYMLDVEMEENYVNVLQLFMTFPCSLTVSDPIPGLPSWVPDFSRNSELLDLSTNYVWFWLHQTTRIGGRKPRAELQHGRHPISLQQIDRNMFKVKGNTLFVQGLMVDEITDIAPSAFCQDLIEDLASNLDDFFELTPYTQAIQQVIKPLLAQLYSNGGTKISTFGDMSDPTSPLFNIMQMRSVLQSLNLQMIEQMCRKHANALGLADTAPDEWMTSIWMDLFEGFGDFPTFTPAQFEAAFNYLACSPSPTAQPYFSDPDPANGAATLRSLLLECGKAGSVMQTHFQEVFNVPKRFFVTGKSGVYGIGPRGICKGDKIVFLFPPFFIAFILRPYADVDTDNGNRDSRYQLVGPCFVPPKRRDVFMDGVRRSGLGLKEFIIL